MKRKTYGLIGLTLVLSVVALLIALPFETRESGVLVSVEKKDETAYTVSLGVDESKPVSEVGVILGSEKEDFATENGANVISATKENGTYTVEIPVSNGNDPVSVQPYVKTEGNDEATLYEPSILDQVNSVVETHSNAVGSDALPASVTTDYDVSAAELPATLQSIAAATWGNEDSVVIHVTGEAVFSNEILFGQKTIFRANGQKLPITINGDGNATLDFDAEKLVSANDFTFADLSMPIGDNSLAFYAGCGQIVFTEVDFGVKNAAAKAKFFGDNYTKAVFAGWNAAALKANANENGLLESGIIFGNEVTYMPVDGSLSAVGFDGEKYEDAEGVSFYVNPEQTAAFISSENAILSEVSARAGIAPVAEARAELQKGAIVSLRGNTKANFMGEQNSFKGTTKLIVNGGKVVGEIQPLYGAYHDGDVHVIITEENEPVLVSTVKAGEYSDLRGSSYLTITGGEFSGDVYGTGATLSTYNSIAGGVFQSDFFGLGNGAAKKIVNNVSGGEFKGNFYGGHFGNGYIRGIVNTFTQGTFQGTLYGGNRSGTLYGAIRNDFNGGTFNGTIVSGNESGEIDSTLAGSITGGNYNGDVIVGSADHSDKSASLSIEYKSRLYINGSIAPRSENESVSMKIVRSNITMGENASLVLTEVTNPSSTYQPILPETVWAEGKVYLTIPPEAKSGWFKLYGGVEESTDENSNKLWTGLGGEYDDSLVAGYEYPVINDGATVTLDGVATDITTKKLTREEVAALPIANSSMSTDELRRLCIDFFELQQNFTWTPNQSVLNYPTCNLSAGVHQDYMNKTLDIGTVYNGIPYQSTGTGNLYRWMEYYNFETGVFNLTGAIEANGGYKSGTTHDTPASEVGPDVVHPGLKILFNQCSVASFWGWARVINSANFLWTYSMNVYNGFIPVGLYSYSYKGADGNTYDMFTISQFGNKTTGNPGFYENGFIDQLLGRDTKAYDAPHVIKDYNKKNGTNAFHNIYAQMKPADCLVSTGHAMMVKSVDPANKTVTVCEQIEGWSIAPYDGYKTANGETFVRQSHTNKTYTFAQLMSSNYIPFTFAEFQDPNKANDPDVIDDADYLDFYNNQILPKTGNVKARYSYFNFTPEEIAEISGAAVEETKVFVRTVSAYETAESGSITVTSAKDIDLKSLPSMSYSRYKSLLFGSNQTISDLFVTITDANGNVIAEKIWRAKTAAIHQVIISPSNSGSMTVNGENMYNGLYDLRNEGYNMTIKMQLSSGELLTLFEGPYKG